MASNYYDPYDKRQDEYRRMAQEEMKRQMQMQSLGQGLLGSNPFGAPLTSQAAQAVRNPSHQPPPEPNTVLLLTGEDE